MSIGTVSAKVNTKHPANFQAFHRIQLIKTRQKALPNPQSKQSLCFDLLHCMLDLSFRTLIQNHCFSKVLSGIRSRASLLYFLQWRQLYFGRSDYDDRFSSCSLRWVIKFSRISRFALAFSSFSDHRFTDFDLKWAYNLLVSHGSKSPLT